MPCIHCEYATGHVTLMGAGRVTCKYIKWSDDKTEEPLWRERNFFFKKYHYI